MARKRRQGDRKHSHRDPLQRRKAHLERLEEKWTIGSMLASLPGGTLTGFLSARAFYDSLTGVSLGTENGSAFAPSRDDADWLLAASSSPLLVDSTSEVDLTVAPSEGGNSVATAEEDDPGTTGTLSGGSARNLLDSGIPLSDWDTDPFPLLLADAQFAMAALGGDTSSSNPQVAGSSFDATGSPASPGTASSSALSTDPSSSGPAASSQGSSYPLANSTDTSLNVAMDAGATTAADSVDSGTNAVAAGTTNSFQVTEGNPITLGDFPADLAGWTFQESGGSDVGQGAVTVITGDAVMREGDSFLAAVQE
jgi:hypothetical protein